MIGKKIIKFDTLDSTNTYIKQHISDLESGDVVVAGEQTHGRGRRGNVWASESGNLYLSFLLKDNMSRDEQFNVLIKSSLSVFRLLRNHGIESNIKYPNDILVDQKKISGILIETSGYDKLDWIVVGIGINVNQKDYKEFDIPATSMAKETERKYNLDGLLSEFISIYNNIQSDKMALLEYSKNLTFIKKTISIDGNSYEIFKLDEFGNLIVKNEKGAKTLPFKDINIEF